MLRDDARKLPEERTLLAYEQHQKSSQQIVARCGVVTLSDTRNEATDTSGARIRELLTEQGHTVTAYRVIKDEPAQLNGLLDDLLSREDVDAILTNGGTGISRRDQTIDVIAGRLELELPGF